MRPPRISLERIEQAIFTIDPVFLATPQFECEPLSAALGATVVVKVESINPIRSFKGRGASLYIGVAVADLYPRITLGASFGFESLKASEAFDWGSRQWSFGPSLSIPVFDRGRRKSVIELREHQQQEAAIGYQQTVLKAWHEVDDAITAYVAETRDGQVARRRVLDAESARATSNTRYAEGLTDYLPALAANQTLLRARRAQAESLGRMRVQLVGVYKSLGTDGSLEMTAAGAVRTLP